MGENGPRVLIVDDERAIRRFLRASLSAQGYSIEEASTGREALSMVVSNRPEIIVLDLGLPDIDGVEVIRQLREWSQIPIIVLSVREGEKEKVAALDAGADDYLTKPFGNQELYARMRVALRRTTQSRPETTYQVDSLVVDLMHRQITADGRDVSLLLQNTTC